MVLTQLRKEPTKSSPKFKEDWFDGYQGTKINPLNFSLGFPLKRNINFLGEWLMDYDLENE